MRIQKLETENARLEGNVCCFSSIIAVYKISWDDICTVAAEFDLSFVYSAKQSILQCLVIGELQTTCHRKDSSVVVYWYYY